MRQFPRLSGVVATVLLVVLAGAAAAADEPAPRAVVPAASFDLAAHAGKVVVLDFWASWCKPCRESMPWLSRLQREHGAKGLQVVAVSVDADEADMRSRLGEIDEGIVVVFDPEGVLASQYKLEGMPTTYLVDRAGKLRGSHLGFRAKDAAAREAEIVALLGEGK